MSPRRQSGLSGMARNAVPCGAMTSITRRSVLKMPALASLAPIRADRLETFVVRVNHRGNWILVRIGTSEGLSGIGDASHGGADAAQIALIGEFFERIKGR